MSTDTNMNQYRDHARYAGHELPPLQIPRGRDTYRLLTLLTPTHTPDKYRLLEATLLDELLPVIDFTLLERSLSRVWRPHARRQHSPRA
jgi:hypothetical protein